MTVHPRHEEARYAMAQRLSRFFYDNRFGSDWLALAGDRFWTRVPKTAGEKHTPSPETRHLTLEMLRDLEASGAARGPSLEEIAEERGNSSRDVASSDTPSDGPTPSSQKHNNELGPSDLSEASAVGAAANQEVGVGLTPSSSSPLEVASDDATPSAPVSPRGRGGQASLPAFQRHSETSREAAIGVKARTDTLRLQVLNLLRERGPMTDEAIAQALNLPQNTARPRRVELVQMGSVIARGKASTASGRKAVTWDLVKFRVVCGWCPTLNVLEEGDRPEPVSHGICQACSQRLENERVSA